MTEKMVDKRVGGTKRAEKARAFIKEVMANQSHPMHYAKDIDFARKFDVSRHTIYKIRHDLSVPDRLARIIERLKNTDTQKKSMKELCAMLNVKYAGLYKIVVENKIPVRFDMKPASAPDSDTVN